MEAAHLHGWDALENVRQLRSRQLQYEGVGQRRRHLDALDAAEPQIFVLPDAPMCEAHHHVGAHHVWFQLRLRQNGLVVGCGSGQDKQGGV